MGDTPDQKINKLREFSACDVADALLKLQKVEKGQKAHAGFLADIAPLSNFTRQPPGNASTVIAPASTFQFIPKNDPLPESASTEEHGIPPGTHWVDWAQPDTIVLIDQPRGQSCAAVGGIMALRMKVLGVKAAVVNGRVRDLDELQDSKLPIWARGTSAVGAGAESKAGARNVPISINEVSVSPGDIVFCDPVQGVVVIPKSLLEDVLALMPKLVAADDKVKQDVLKGSTVFEAFRKHR
ncbi:hypothetical protein FQN54_000279 [Arachnomyces sp. PD_36]|nr:hypothetical protein FQN54_000279 [Arachnomyces sp. PD_36]